MSTHQIEQLKWLYGSLAGICLAFFLTLLGSGSTAQLVDTSILVSNRVWRLLANFFGVYARSYHVRGRAEAFPRSPTGAVRKVGQSLDPALGFTFRRHDFFYDFPYFLCFGSSVSSEWTFNVVCAQNVQELTQ